MTMQSPLGRARGLGSAKEGVGHWWHQRQTALALVPLLLWLVISVIANVGADHASMKSWLTSPFNATMMILLIFAGFYHALLGVQVVVEDYVSCKAMKVAALIATRLLCIGLGTWAAVSVLIIASGG